MRDEARSMWLEFITSSENGELLKRYAKSAAEPEPLFEAIGEDLGNSSQEIREQAFWALVAATPELLTILHERESRQPKSREGGGENLHMVVRRVNLLTKLYDVLVKEGRFKADERMRKDPRPYVNTVVRNWQIDALRTKQNRDLSLERLLEQEEKSPEVAGLPASTISIEDEVLEAVNGEECRRELESWGLLTPDELALFEAVYIDELSLPEARRHLNIPSDAALRKRIKGARERVIAARRRMSSSQE